MGYKMNVLMIMVLVMISFQVVVTTPKQEWNFPCNAITGAFHLYYNILTNPHHPHYGNVLYDASACDITNG